MATVEGTANNQPKGAAEDRMAAATVAVTVRKKIRLK